jgi:hypothetical protein
VLARHYSDYYLTRIDDVRRQDRLVSLHARIFERLLVHAPGSRRLSFLDHGFGGGAFLRYVAQQGHGAFGTEDSPQNIRQLREAAGRDGVEMLRCGQRPSCARAEAAGGSPVAGMGHRRIGTPPARRRPVVLRDRDSR